MWLPDAEQVSVLHSEIVRLFAGDDDPISPAGIRSPHLLESACTRPTTSLGRVDKYPGVNEKLAALFHSLVKNHAFYNGNKRIALATLLTGLHRNDLRLRNDVTDDELYQFVLDVADNHYPSVTAAKDDDLVVKAIGSWIGRRSEHATHKMGSMRTANFVGRCVEAGATARYTNGSYMIAKSGRSIRIAGSTRQLDRPVLTKYLRLLGLNVNQSGFDNSEFREGVSSERQQIYRFTSTLLRLAKT